MAHSTWPGLKPFTLSTIHPVFTYPLFHSVLVLDSSAYSNWYNPDNILLNKIDFAPMPMITNENCVSLTSRSWSIKCSPEDQEFEPSFESRLHASLVSSHIVFMLICHFNSWSGPQWIKWAIPANNDPWFHMFYKWIHEFNWLNSRVFHTWIHWIL